MVVDGLSGSLRIELLRQIDGLNSTDEAALWAQRRLVAKNQLSAADARQVEEAFAAKLAWRICFTWTEEGPADVEIVDYH
jgi:hypothetical protein